MEIPLSTVTGAVRIGVQVAANQRRPVLEVYHELRNVFGPPQKYRYGAGSRHDQLEESSTRFQDVFVQFVLVNLGGLRAENIALEFDGKFDRNNQKWSLADIELFRTEIAQLAPGQALFLFRVDKSDFSRYPEGGGKPLGLKDETFTITASYSGPAAGLNRIPRWWSGIRKKSQYKMRYVFDPKVIRTDFPSPEYHG